MKKLLITIALSPIFLMASDKSSLKDWLHERIWEYESTKELLTDSSDIYTYYMVFGKQAAYQEVLILIEKLEKEASLQSGESSESYQ